MDKYERALEKILEIAREKTDTTPSGTLPESETNADTSNDSVDAHTLQNEMIENPREGHITGTGGPVVKRADLSEAQQAEVNSYNRDGMNMVMPLAMPLANLNKAVLSNPFTASLGYGLAGAGLARGAIGVKNLLSGRPRTEQDKRRQRNQTMTAGLLSGLAGLGLMKKRSSFAGGDPMSLIQSKIMSDNTLTSVQQQVMIDAASQMSPTKQFGLAQVLMGLVGAGIGAAVARFISNMGVFGTIGGGVVGGLVGSRIGSEPMPSTGDVNNSVDFFGRPF